MAVSFHPYQNKEQKETDYKITSRYNLKRRVASLPPLSSEIFAEKVLASKADAAATAARASFERACEPCQKTYFSENAFNNHVGSSKHRTNIAKARRSGKKSHGDAQSVMSSTFSLGDTNTQNDEDEEDDELESENSAEEEFEQVVKGIKKADIKDSEDDPVSRRPSRPHHSAAGQREEHPISQVTTNGSDAKKSGDDAKTTATRECLYCNHYAPDLDANVAHMFKEHGMFLPEREYLADLEGLIVFLNRKVHYHYQCTSCNRLKWSEDGIKTHMRDLGHCKIAYETEDEQLEIGKFYDFRSTYSDEGEDWESDSDEEIEDAPVRRSKLGAKRETKGSDEEGEGWETDDTVSSVPTEELGKVYVDDDREKEEKYGRLKTHRHHARSAGSHHRSADGFHSHAHKATNAVYHDEFELHLPTGRVAGHRTLNKYYRQNLRTYPTPEERQQRLLTAEEDGEEEQPRGRARGSKDLISRADGGLGMLHVSDEKKRAVKAMEKKERRNEGRALRTQEWRVNKGGNSQKHFRDHLLQ